METFIRESVLRGFGAGRFSKCGQDDASQSPNSAERQNRGILEAGEGTVKNGTEHLPCSHHALSGLRVHQRGLIPADRPSQPAIVSREVQLWIGKGLFQNALDGSCLLPRDAGHAGGVHPSQ